MSAATEPCGDETARDAHDVRDVLGFQTVDVAHDGGVALIVGQTAQVLDQGWISFSSQSAWESATEILDGDVGEAVEERAEIGGGASLRDGVPRANESFLDGFLPALTVQEPAVTVTKEWFSVDVRSGKEFCSQPLGGRDRRHAGGKRRRKTPAS